MKRFKFRLQTLLEQRLAKEEKLLWELGEIRREEAKEIVTLHGLEANLDSARASVEESLRENKPLDEVLRWDEYSKTLRDDIRVQELTIEAVRERVEQKRVEVVRAMQDRKVLEALKDKQEREYLKTAAKEELNQLDEMASVRYARGM